MDPNRIDISIIVPVYNSAETIPELVMRVVRAMGSAGLTYEVILVDDRSTDTSWQAILMECHQSKRIIGLRLADNNGQWRSSLAGMSLASGRYIVTMDDDLEYDPLDIPELYKAIFLNNHSVVFGLAPDKYRLQGKNEMLSKLRNRILNILWNKPVTDSFKIIDRKVIFQDGRFKLTEPFEVFMTHHLKKTSWGYHTVRFNNRRAGTSNHSLSMKAKLFFIYSAYFLHYPGRKAILLTLLLLSIAIIAFSHDIVGFVHDKRFFAISIAWLFILIVDIYYLLSILSRPKSFSGFSIAEMANRAED